MSKEITKDKMALLEEASEMFDETGCVPGSAEKMVPDVKVHLGNDLRPGSDLRPRDMGYAWVCAGPFVAGTKMAEKMSKASISRE
jgi:hypothetical protein